MKNNITIILVLILFLLSLNSKALAVAATVTPTIEKQPSSTPSGALDARIQKIKDMVASRVAELKLVEKKGILGTVREASNTQLTVEDMKGTKKYIDIDELTKFEDPSNKSFGISDIKKADAIYAVGLYNKDTKRLLARVIGVAKTVPVQFDGAVVGVDTKNGSLVVINQKGDKKTVDVGKSTKTSKYSKESGIERSGFSKIQTAERVLVTGYYDLKDKNLILASRILHFVDVAVSSETKNNQIMQQGTTSQTPTLTPAKRLTPTKTTLR